jgi:hypothetical protein
MPVRHWLIQYDRSAADNVTNGRRLPLCQPITAAQLRQFSEPSGRLPLSPPSCDDAADLANSEHAVTTVRRLIDARRNKQKGQSIVEIAFSLPLILILVLGIFELGIVFATYLGVVNAAREGAVFASKYPKLVDANCGRNPHDDGNGRIVCAGADDNDMYDLSAGGTLTTTVWEEYAHRIENDAFIQPGERLRAEGLIASGVFWVERPYAPSLALGEPISVTVHYTVSTMTSGFSVPLFGRLGLPNAYHIRYEYSMPIRTSP